MSNLCRVPGKSIQFVYNIYGGKGWKGRSESLWKLTVGAEKYMSLYIPNGGSIVAPRFPMVDFFSPNCFLHKKLAITAPEMGGGGRQGE